jgi:hypothetical protein
MVIAKATKATKATKAMRTTRKTRKRLFRKRSVRLNRTKKQRSKRGRTVGKKRRSYKGGWPWSNKTIDRRDEEYKNYDEGESELDKYREKEEERVAREAKKEAEAERIRAREQEEEAKRERERAHKREREEREEAQWAKEQELLNEREKARRKWRTDFYKYLYADDEKVVKEVNDLKESLGKEEEYLNNNDYEILAKPIRKLMRKFYIQKMIEEQKSNEEGWNYNLIGEQQRDYFPYISDNDLVWHFVDNKNVLLRDLPYPPPDNPDYDYYNPPKNGVKKYKKVWKE